MSKTLNALLAVGRLYNGVRGLWAFGVLLLGGGTASLLITAFGGPWVLALVLSLVIVVSACLYFGLPPGPGIYNPRYLKWYVLPTRRVSWDFGNYLGMSAKQGENLTISSMQFDLRSNFGGDIVPTDGVVVSLNTGQKVSIELKGPQGFVPVASIETIPAKTKIHGQVLFSDGPLTDSEFLRRFSGFDFRFSYNGQTFERRFTRSELESVIDGFRRYSNPSPERRLVTKGDS